MKKLISVLSLIMVSLLLVSCNGLNNDPDKPNWDPAYTVVVNIVVDIGDNTEKTKESKTFYADKEGNMKIDHVFSVHLPYQADNEKEGLTFYGWTRTIGTIKTDLEDINSVNEVHDERVVRNYTLENEPTGDIDIIFEGDWSYNEWDKNWYGLSKYLDENHELELNQAGDMVYFLDYEKVVGTTTYDIRTMINPVNKEFLMRQEFYIGLNKFELYLGFYYGDVEDDKLNASLEIYETIVFSGTSGKTYNSWDNDIQILNNDGDFLILGLYRSGSKGIMTDDQVKVFTTSIIIYANEYFYNLSGINPF